MKDVEATVVVIGVVPHESESKQEARVEGKQLRKLAKSAGPGGASLSEEERGLREMGISGVSPDVEGEAPPYARNRFVLTGSGNVSQVVGGGGSRIDVGDRNITIKDTSTGEMRDVRVNDYLPGAGVVDSVERRSVGGSPGVLSIHVMPDDPDMPGYWLAEGMGGGRGGRGPDDVLQDWMGPEGGTRLSSDVLSGGDVTRGFTDELLELMGLGAGVMSPWVGGRLAEGFTGASSGRIADVDEGEVGPIEALHEWPEDVLAELREKNEALYEWPEEELMERSEESDDEMLRVMTEAGQTENIDEVGEGMAAIREDLGAAVAIDHFGKDPLTGMHRFEISEGGVADVYTYDPQTATLTRD